MLRLTTFGGLSLSSDGQPLTGAAAQKSRLALLALLASAGPTGISRDKLLLYLWAESDSERARHALKQAVYALRRDLGADDAIQGTSALTLNPLVVESDIRDFETALAKRDYEAAVAAYGGPFLDGVYLKDAAEFERWTAEQRTRLAQEWSKAVEELARDAETRGEWRAAVTRWRQLAAAEPMSGRVASALMRALAESGDSAGALQHYRVHEAMVREELESAPDLDVVTLADDLKSGRWQRSAPPEAVRIAPPRPAQPEVATPAALTTTTAAAPVPAEIPAPTPTPRTSSGAQVAAAQGRRRSRWLVVAMAAVITVFVAGVAYTYFKTPAQYRPLYGTRATRLDPHLFLVRPFESHADSSLLNGFGPMAGQWLTETLTDNRLQAVRWEDVVSSGRVLTPAMEQIRRIILAGWIVLGIVLGIYFFGVQTTRDGWMRRWRRRNPHGFTALVALSPIGWLGIGLGAALVRPGDPLFGLVSAENEAIGLAVYRGAQHLVRGEYYVLGGDTVFVQVRIINVQSRAVENLFDATGPASDYRGTLAKLAAKMMPALQTLVDSRAGAPTVSLVAPPSIEAYNLMADAWQNWFLHPDDTVAVFHAFARAKALDTGYVAPDVLTGYIRDVKQQWAGVAESVGLLIPRRSRLGLAGQLALTMYEADLAGNGLARLRTARDLRELSPRSSEMEILVIMSSLYAGRPHDAMHMVEASNPDVGINLISHAYWEWATKTWHEMADSAREDKASRSGLDRFRTEPSIVEARVRVLAVRGDVAGIERLLRDDSASIATDSIRQNHWLVAGREMRAHGRNAQGDSVLRALSGDFTNVPPTSPIAVLRHAAEVLHEAGSYEKAIALCDLILKQDPNDLVARGRKGTAAARLGRTSEADGISAQIAALKLPHLLGRDKLWRAHIAAAAKRPPEYVSALLDSAVAEGYRIIDTRPWTPHADGDFVEFRATGAYGRLIAALEKRPVP